MSRDTHGRTHTHTGLQTHTDTDAHRGPQCARAQDTLFSPGLPAKNLGMNANLTLFPHFSSCQISSMPVSQNPREKREGMVLQPICSWGSESISLSTGKGHSPPCRCGQEWQEAGIRQKRGREGPQRTLWHASAPSPAPSLPSPPVMEQPPVRATARGPPLNDPGTNPKPP